MTMTPRADKDRAPSIFISHGSPMFALEPGRLGPQLTALGQSLGNISAAMVVSPHWQTVGPLRLTHNAAPETIHDFGGFPAPLYALRYPSKGAPESAERTAELLKTAGLPVGLDDRRGLDHGAWVPLMHLFPKADIPVFQLSMPLDLTATAAFALGSLLAELRNEGILIIGSGSLTHNLYELQRTDPKTVPYVGEFANWVNQIVLNGSHQELINYRAIAPHAVRAHPTEEHFLPLLVAMGAGMPDHARLMEGGIEYGVLSMNSYIWQ